MLAARKGRRTVSMAEFEEAKDKVMMGSERRSMVMTDDEKKLTAYHELVMQLLHCIHQLLIQSTRLRLFRVAGRSAW